MNKFIVQLNKVLYIGSNECVSVIISDAKKFDTEFLAGEALSRIRKRLNNDFETAVIETITI
jgi:hypothetical protein